MRHLPWVFGSMLISTTLLGQSPCTKPKRSFECSQEIVKAKLTPGYNAPARIDVRGSWNFKMEGSFVYLQPMQDQMHVAFANATNSSLLPTTSTTSSVMRGEAIELKKKYHPGFQIALGLYGNEDNWDLGGQYTYLRAKNQQQNKAPIGGVLLASRGHPLIVNNNTFDTAKQTWHSKLDLVDLELSRNYFVGKLLTMRPCFGAKALFTRQAITTTSTNENTESSTPVNAVPGKLLVEEKNHSWGVGPKMGLSSNWELSEGLSLVAQGASSLLYSEYLIQSETAFQRNANSSSNAGYVNKVATTSRLRTLRPHMEMETGLRYGIHFNRHNWHLSFGASYGFQVFFQHNMFPTFTSDTLMMAKHQMSEGNLYVHGAKASLRLDF